MFLTSFLFLLVSNAKLLEQHKECASVSELTKALKEQSDRHASELKTRDDEIACLKAELAERPSQDDEIKRLSAELDGQQEKFASVVKGIKDDYLKTIKDQRENL